MTALHIVLAAAWIAGGLTYGWVRGNGTLGDFVICLAFWPAFLVFDLVDRLIP